jgi:hypothetical protein
LSRNKFRGWSAGKQSHCGLYRNATEAPMFKSCPSSDILPINKTVFLCDFFFQLQCVRLPRLAFGRRNGSCSRHCLSRQSPFVVFPSSSNQMPNITLNKVSLQILSNSIFVTIQCSVGYSINKNITHQNKLRKERIAWFPLIRHGLHRKEPVQQFFYCCVYSLPSKDRRDAHPDTRTDGRYLWRTPLRWAQVPWYTVHTTFHEDWFRHSTDHSQGEVTQTAERSH